MAGTFNTREIPTAPREEHEPAPSRSEVGSTRVLWMGRAAPPPGIAQILTEAGCNVCERNQGSWPAQRVAWLAKVSAAARAHRGLRGRRVAVVHPDPGAADALAEALRARGAQVVVLSLGEAGLDRAEALDPDVIVMQPDHLVDSGLEVIQSVWRHARLRWIPILLVPHARLGSAGASAPNVRELAIGVNLLCSDYEALARRACRGDPFEMRLEELGPMRTMRALLESPSVQRVRFETAWLTIEVDLGEGLIIGAQGGARGSTERDSLLGVHAIAALQAQLTGKVSVRSVAHPAVTNIMAPLEAMLLGQHAAPLLADDTVAPRLSSVEIPQAEASEPDDSFDSPTHQRVLPSHMRMAVSNENSKAAAAQLFRPARPPKKLQIRESVRPNKSAQIRESARPDVDTQARETMRPDSSQIVLTQGPSAAVRERAQASVTLPPRITEPVQPAQLTEPAPSAQLIEPAQLTQAEQTEPPEQQLTMPVPPPPLRQQTEQPARQLTAPAPPPAPRPQTEHSAQLTAPAPPAQAVAPSPPTQLAAPAQQKQLAAPAQSKQLAPPAMPAPPAPLVRPMAPAPVARASSVQLSPSLPPSLAPAPRLDPWPAIRIETKQVAAPSELDDLDPAAQRRVSWRTITACLALGMVVLTAAWAWHDPDTWLAQPATRPSARVTPAAVPTEKTEARALDDTATTPAVTAPEPHQAPAAAATASPAAAPEPLPAAAPEPLPAAAPEPLPAAAPEDDEAEEDDSGSEALRPTQAREASKLVGRGHQLRRERKYEAARATYDEAARIYPNYPRALAGLAETYLALGDKKRALEAARAVVKRRPHFADDHRLLGDAYRLNGRMADALAAYRQAVELGSRTARERLKTSL